MNKLLTQLLTQLNLPNNLFRLKKNRQSVRGLFTTKSYEKGEQILKLSVFETRRTILNRQSDSFQTFIRHSPSYNRLSKNGQFAALLSITRLNKMISHYWKMIPTEKKELKWNVWFWKPSEIDKSRFYRAYKEKLENEYDLFGSLYDEYTQHFGKMIYSMKKKKFQEKCILMRIMVTSRVFGFMNKTKDKHVVDMALVPILDLLNHGNKEKYNTKWEYVDEGNYFVMTALKDIPKHTELLDSYGHNKSNETFRTFYGFIPK